MILISRLAARLAKLLLFAATSFERFSCGRQLRFAGHALAADKIVATRERRVIDGGGGCSCAQAKRPTALQLSRAAD